MQTQADMGIGPVSCENCSVFLKKGEGGPEAPGALRLRNKKATASVASSYSQNPPVAIVRIDGCVWMNGWPPVPVYYICVDGPVIKMALSKNAIVSDSNFVKFHRHKHSRRATASRALLFVEP